MEVVEAGATVDLGLMIGWFANAIETARTEAATGDAHTELVAAADLLHEAIYDAERASAHLVRAGHADAGARAATASLRLHHVREGIEEALHEDEPRPPYVAAVVASEALSRLRRVDSTVHNLIDAVTSIEKTLRAYPKAER